MKKISLLVLSIATAFAATAQVSVLKEAERAMKNGTEGAKVEEAIKPAFTDPETATMAQTWYIPGKAYFQDFDKMYKLRTINPNDPSATPAKMGDALVNCFEYYIKALPLDSVADKKGKIKTKYSKEIYKTLGAWVDDLSGLGGDMFNSHDYAGAAEAWKLTADLLTNPEVTKNRAQGAPADSIIGQTYNNLALASYFNKDIPGALQAYRDATKHDYKNSAFMTTPSRWPRKPTTTRQPLHSQPRLLTSMATRAMSSWV